MLLGWLYHDNIIQELFNQSKNTAPTQVTWLATRPKDLANERFTLESKVRNYSR